MNTSPKKIIFPIVLIIAILHLGMFPFSRPFPKFQYTDQYGNTISEEVFTGKKTVVIHCHLGCQAAMNALIDLNRFLAELDSSKRQIVGIFENTPWQVSDFFSPDTTLWTGFKKYFPGLEKPVFSMLAECGKEILEENADGDTVISIQCRKVSRKLATRISPSIYWVNEKGNIEKRMRYYYINVSEEVYPDRRQAFLDGFK